MSSVTGRINQITQPRGGYLPPKSMHVEELKDKIELNDIEMETISPSIVGMAVDYITRYLYLKNIFKKYADPKIESTPEALAAAGAFDISLKGAEYGQSITRIPFYDYALGLVQEIVSKEKLDDTSIRQICYLSTFDGWYRSGKGGTYESYEDMNIDNFTVYNIKMMVNRCIEFIISQNICCCGYTFDGGYTDIITTGDGDYASNDTLWDLKVSKNEPTTKHTLQILIYYLMSQHSEDFVVDPHNIKNIGLFNPRLNKIYKISIDELPLDVINEVSQKVIGYGQ